VKLKSQLKIVNINSEEKIVVVKYIGRLDEEMGE